jgi:arylsulfatase A-like enzyme
MAEEGVRLTSFYSFPTCTPSRAALLTGRYPIRSGLVRVLHPGERFGIPDTEVTLAEALKDQGYSTALIGKWHLGSLPPYRPNRHGFDYYYGLLYSNDMVMQPPHFRRLRLYRNDSAIEWPVDQNTLTQRYTRQAVEFILANRHTPFFLYLAHSMPHVPLHVSQRFRGRSREGLYGDAVAEIDWSMGEILQALQRFGLDQHTLVMFTSDNGPAVGLKRRGGSAGPFRGGKHTTWEGGVRVPFLARWPGRLPPGGVRHGMATLMDLFPTLVELAGGEVAAGRDIDGRCILEILEGKAPSPHETFYYYYGTEIFALRWRNWKLHFYKRENLVLNVGHTRKCDPPELYNLDEDPAEQVNRAGGEPELVARLSRLSERFLAAVKPGRLPPRLPLPL